MNWATWDELRDILFDSRLDGYGNGQNDWSDKELDYLREAYERTETLWQSQVEKIAYPRAVLLGEAPLFGASGSYIYAHDVDPTAFLRPSDFKAALGAEPTGQDKATLLSLMQQFGVVVVDAYPYAFNPDDTPTLFYTKPRKGAELRKLLHNVFPLFAERKLEYLSERNPNLRILIRYKRLDRTLAPLLAKMGFREGTSAGCYCCVGSNNMGIDRELFGLALRQ